LSTEEIYTALAGMGVIKPGHQPPLVPLTGGVSSEIYRIDLASGPVCVKRALAKLKVEKDWFAPVERNAFEVAWIKIANEIAPGAAPKVLGHDADAQMFVMEFLEPGLYPVWKEQLRTGVIEAQTAANLGALMVKIHSETAGNEGVRAKFEGSAALFYALRIEPYLLSTAQSQPGVAGVIEQIAQTTQATTLALVHGDFSPKNILIGLLGPVLLDSETANYGDPAFDLAFCLNHLLLKCIWHPQWKDGYLQCFDALAATYKAGVTWEPVAGLEERATALLSAFLLARIDGKSPAEDITEKSDKDFVRGVAIDLLQDLPKTLDAICVLWQSKMKER